MMTVIGKTVKKIPPLPQASKDGRKVSMVNSSSSALWSQLQPQPIRIIPKEILNSNFTTDPIYGCLCTSRTWTLINISLKLAYVFAYLMDNLLSSLLSSARQNSYVYENGNGNGWRHLMPSSDAEAFFELAEVLVNVVMWSLLPLLLLYGVALFGAVEEKTGLITFYGCWLFLENLYGLILVLYLHLNFGIFSFVALPFLFGLWVWNAFGIMCAVEFRKRVDFRKSLLNQYHHIFI